MTDVSLQYAEALYFLANEQNKVQDIKVVFESFLPIFETHLKGVLLHPKPTNQEKKDLIKGLKMDVLFQDFLSVLIDKYRIDLVYQIFDAYEALLDHQMDVLRATVMSSRPLSDAQIANIKTALGKKLKRKIEIENIIDKKIVGGIKIAYEGRVLDNTINHFITSLTENVKA